MQVLKFGGSSVANATNISRVLDIVTTAAGKDRVILVLSAISGCTDSLLAISSGPGDPDGRLEMAAPLLERHKDIITRLFTGKERDEAMDECKSIFESMVHSPAEEIVTFGELLSSSIVARKLACDRIETLWLDSRKLIIKGDKDQTYKNISDAIEANPGVRVFVAPGFIASDAKGRPTTLGRGGSDYSAAIYAAGAKADTLEIWTDVPGMMTANPKTVPLARTIPLMSYGAALDMATHGAKVLYAPTVKPAMDAGLPINIRNTFNPSDPGTIISSPETSGSNGWTGVTSTDSPQKEETLIYLINDTPINPEASCDRVTDCLRKAGIEPLEVTSSDTDVCASVRTAVATAALQALHREFFETVPLSETLVFIAGFGSVAKAFIQLLGENAAAAQRNGKALRIIGLGNSHRYIIDKEAISPQEAAQKLESGVYYSGSKYIDAILECAPRRSIFIDLTDSEDIHRSFTRLLRAGINIVTSNRRSIAVPFVEFAAMKAAARENGAFIRYETTVGSALPVLGSISLSANSGDEILSIEAVVSCTLNQIFSSYDLFPGTFADIVRKAQEDGLTEKDPRIDLAGTDALRKLLIISREAGIPLEERDVEIRPVIGMDTPLDRLYPTLEAMEPQFAAAEREADKTLSHQRFVATLRKDPASPNGYKASVRTRLVDQKHPAYWLKGTENALIIRSAFHPYPLLIQGPGEGAQQAAGSVLNDVLR